MVRIGLVILATMVIGCMAMDSDYEEPAVVECWIPPDSSAHTFGAPPPDSDTAGTFVWVVDGKERLCRERPAGNE